MSSWFVSRGKIELSGNYLWRDDAREAWRIGFAGEDERFIGIPFMRKIDAERGLQSLLEAGMPQDDMELVKAWFRSTGIEAVNRIACADLAW